MPDITLLLDAAAAGDPNAAAALLPLVYDELRKLATARLAHERPGQNLQATALRLVGPGLERPRPLLRGRRPPQRLFQTGGGRCRVPPDTTASILSDGPRVDDLPTLDEPQSHRASLLCRL